MFWIDFVFALFFAFFFVLILSSVFRREAPWPLALFFVFFLIFIWAGGVWLTPVGPVLWEGYWLPFFFVGLIFMLLVAALLPSRGPRQVPPTEAEASAESKTAAALGAFFWILFLVLFAALIVHYV